MTEKSKTLKEKGFLGYPFLTLIVMIIITIGATFLFYQNSVYQDQIRFKHEVLERKKSLTNKISSSLTLLGATRGFIKTNDQLSRDKFKVFVNNLDIKNKLASVQGVGYSIKVQSVGKEELVRRMTNDGLPDFKIFPEGEREEFQTVLYLEPQDFKNEGEIGYDMMTEKTRNEAMNLAKSTGEPKATGITKLYNSTDNQESSVFLIYLPVYQSKNFPANTEERDRLLQGYVFSSFRLNEFMNEIYENVTDNQVGVIIYDTEIKPEKMLASSQSGLADIDSVWTEIQNIDVAGRQWLVEYKSLPVFSNNSDVKFTPIITFCGLLLSILLYGLTYAEATSRLRFENIAKELSASEKIKNQLLLREKKEREQAERSNIIKDEFLSLISHELRTPLNSITGWAKILQGKSITESTKKRALKMIEKSVRSQTELVEELIDFSKINSDDFQLKKKSVEIKSIVEESINEIKDLASKKDIEIIKENDLDEEKVFGEKKIIKRALIHLMKNAVKFTPEKGKIKIIGKNLQNTFQLSIIDNGQGIEKALLPQIFEKFKQADSSTTRKFGGLGLGLSISKQIVRLHQGHIEVKSEGKGKGTEFIVKLPLENETN